MILGGDSFHLMDPIHQVFSHDLLKIPVEASEAGAPIFSPPHDLTGLALSSMPFQSTLPLSNQVWRAATSSDVFMQEPSSAAEMLNGSRSFRLDTKESSLQSSQAPAWRPEVNFGDNQWLTASQGDQYKSWTGAPASSSVSSQGDSSDRASVCPELLRANSPSNSRFSAHDSCDGAISRTPSSVRLHGQLMDIKQIRRTTSCGDQYEIQKALSLFEAQQMQEQWRQQDGFQLNSESQETAVEKLSPSPNGQENGKPASAAQLNESTTLQGALDLEFQAWQGAPSLRAKTTDDLSIRQLSKRNSNVDLMNQVSKIAGPLMRGQSLSALEMLKEVDTYQQQVANLSPDQIRLCQEPRIAHINGPNLRGRRKLGVENPTPSGVVHAGHDEAAVNHMLAERRRRVKQKENFTTLRRMVPIISKADKASTLIDAITYLKDLQQKIQEMEASKEVVDKRCNNLVEKCKELEKRNQELVAILSKATNTPFL